MTTATATTLHAEFAVLADHPSLAGHFPGRPVVPGVLLLDHVMSAVEDMTGHRVSQVDHVKFLAVLQPAEVARLHGEVLGMRVTFKLRARRGELDVELAQGALALSVMSPRVSPSSNPSTPLITTKA